MPKFKVCVTTTFNKWYEVDAKNADEATKSIEDGIDSGELDAVDTDEFDTTITDVYEDCGRATPAV